MKKYNDESAGIDNWTTKKLKKDALFYYRQVKKDYKNAVALTMYDAIMTELRYRHITSRSVYTLKEMFGD